MNPPLFPLFCHAPLSTLRTSRTCSLMLATASELTMADPPRAQSDEMDAVSINSDRAELDAADANRVVYPLRVKTRERPSYARKPVPVFIAGALGIVGKKCIQTIYSLTRCSFL